MLEVLILVIILTISRLYPHASGWAKLTELYPDNGLHSGFKNHCCDVRFGLLRHRVVLHVCPEGLGISLPWPFSTRLWGYPPIFIPWSEFRVVTVEGFLFPMVVADIGQPVVAQVRLPVWLEKHLSAGKPHPSRK